MTRSNDAPATVNEDPLGKGWLVKLRIADAAELDALMDEDAYRAFLESRGVSRCAICP